MLVGITMLASSFYVDDMLEAPDVRSLTIIFIFIYALCATQDIAVDGWVGNGLSHGLYLI